MTEKRKNRVVVLGFFLVLWGFLLAFICLEDKVVSLSERRTLTKFPELSTRSLFTGKWMGELEEYFLDHFPLRDEFRTLKAGFSLNLLQKKENNGIFLVGDGVYKLEYPLKEKQVAYGAQKINELYATYLQGMRVYFGLIPDKNYYLAEEGKKSGILTMDYSKMREILGSKLNEEIRVVELFDCLSLEDYYRTDPHWRQEKLARVVARLGEKMGVDLPSLSEYSFSSFGPFYGAYYGQSALNLKPDEIIYLQRDTLVNSTLYDLEKDMLTSLYDLEGAKGMDGYD